MVKGGTLGDPLTRPATAGESAAAGHPLPQGSLCDNSGKPTAPKAFWSAARRGGLPLCPGRLAGRALLCVGCPGASKLAGRKR